MDYDYARGEINYGVDRLSIGAVLPLAPAADYEGKFGQTSPEFQQDVLTGDKFQHQLGQGFYDNSQDGNLDSFTISVTNSLSNLSISVQTPSSKRTLDHQPNQSLVTITNTDTPQIHGNYRADSDTFGRSQVPVTHQLHNTYKTPQPAQAPLSLFAELSAAAGGDNPFGGPLHQNSFAPTLSPSLSVSIEAGNHKLSIINNSSTPIDITATAHSQSPAHNQIPPQIAKNAAKKKSPNSLPRQPSKSPSQPIQPKRTSAFTSSSSNGKYIDTSKRLSTATSSTFINSPNGSGQMVSSPSAITSTSPSSPNTVINVSHSRTSSSHGKSSSNPRISSSSTADRSSKRVSGNATSTVSKRSSGPSQSTSPTGHKSTSTSPVGQPRPKSSKANKLPLTPEACLFGYKDLLTSYEHREIFDFPEVYYLGAPGVNKVGTPNRRVGGIEKTPPGKEPEVFNYGYDDSRGDYYLTPRDHIGYRYEIVSLLGKGSFGQVVKCFDHKEKRHVALKIIRNKKRFEKQGTVEVKVLDKMRTVV
ncbi:Dual specificity tyrosine-phosphorylation-regulated kinase 2 [Nowakowskiella sp. JEL0407]|nr:Dual specificity tyrosine-phosphorylation-regulated kinase 2 [Nowakowskiella sp. JEL0407]